jgi:hypothetical protein
MGLPRDLPRHARQTASFPDLSDRALAVFLLLPPQAPGMQINQGGGFGPGREEYGSPAK